MAELLRAWARELVSSAVPPSAWPDVPLRAASSPRSL